MIEHLRHRRSPRRGTADQIRCSLVVGDVATASAGRDMIGADDRIGRPAATTREGGQHRAYRHQCATDPQPQAERHEAHSERHPRSSASVAGLSSVR